MKQAGQPALGVGPCRRTELTQHPVLRLCPERPRHVQHSFPLPREPHCLDPPVRIRRTLDHTFALQKVDTAGERRLIDGERTLEVLRGFPGRVVLHCFALPDDVDEVIERGWWASFAGNVTYPSAVPLQEAARRIPLERLLVETDSPYLAPVPNRGKPCRPAMVLDTLRFIAELRGDDPEALGRAVVASADAAFALPA